MAAIEVITGIVTAQTALTAVTVAVGNSLTIRAFNPPDKAYIVAAWADGQLATGGALRIRSPRMHDAVEGLRLTFGSSEPISLLPLGYPQEVYSQDVLTVELADSGVAADIATACLLIYYTNLSASNAHLIDSRELQARFTGQILGQNISLALGVAGGYSGEEAITADRNTFKANTEYAVLGMTFGDEAAVVRFRGSDTGNLGIGIPANPAHNHHLSRFFVEYSDALGVPFIPVINSANATGILVDGAQDENGLDVLVSFILAELR